MVGAILAQSLEAKPLNPTEQKFTLVLLAYLAKKRLWKNTLQDDPVFYTDSESMRLIHAWESCDRSSLRKRELSLFPKECSIDCRSRVS